MTLPGSEPKVPHADARFGAYRIVRELGRVGMGTVFLAERADGQFEQQVAVKVVHREFGARDMHERFLRERQILARLEHPNIAHLVDGGITGDGQPWFAMEFVDGPPLDRPGRPWSRSRVQTSAHCNAGSMIPGRRGC